MSYCCEMTSDFVALIIPRLVIGECLKVKSKL